GTLIGLLLAALLAAIDQTIVGTAEPRIIAQLSGFDRYPWIATAYLLTSTVSVPIFASLSDIHGRKPFFMLGAPIFVATSPHPARHPRPHAVLHAGGADLRRDVGALRRGGHAALPADGRHGSAHSLSRPPGRRRGDGAGTAVHDRRRHLFARRAGPLSGAL